MIDIIKNIYNLTGYINGLTYAKDDDAAGMIRDSCDTLEVCLDELDRAAEKRGHGLIVNDYGKRKCNGCRDLRAGRVWRGTRMWICTRVQGINHNGRRCVLMENVVGDHEPDILTPCWCRTGRRTA